MAWRWQMKVWRQIETKLTHFTSFQRQVDFNLSDYPTELVQSVPHSQVPHARTQSPIWYWITVKASHPIRCHRTQRCEIWFNSFGKLLLFLSACNTQGRRVQGWSVVTAWIPWITSCDWRGAKTCQFVVQPKPPENPRMHRAMPSGLVRSGLVIRRGLSRSEWTRVLRDSEYGVN